VDLLQTRGVDKRRVLADGARVTSYRFTRAMAAVNERQAVGLRNSSYSRWWDKLSETEKQRRRDRSSACMRKLRQARSELSAHRLGIASLQPEGFIEQSLNTIPGTGAQLDAPAPRSSSSDERATMSVSEAVGQSSSIVLGPRHSAKLEMVDTQREQAGGMRDYNPTVNAMVETQAQINKVLRNAEPLVDRVKARKRKINFPSTVTASSSVALHNACLERLRALKSQFDNSYEPLLALFAQNGTAQLAQAAVAPVIAPVLAVPAGPQPAVIQPPGIVLAPNPVVIPLAPPPPSPLPWALRNRTAQPAVRSAVLPETISGTPLHGRMTPRPVDLVRTLSWLPWRYHDKLARIQEYIADKPDVVGSSPGGQLMVRGAIVPGAAIGQTFSALFTAPKRQANTAADTAGLGELLGALRSIGVPSNVITSRIARARYGALATAMPTDVSSNINTPTLANQYGSGFGRNKYSRVPFRSIKCLRLYAN